MVGDMLFPLFAESPTHGALSLLHCEGSTDKRILSPACVVVSRGNTVLASVPNFSPLYQLLPRSADADVDWAKVDPMLSALMTWENPISLAHNDDWIASLSIESSVPAIEFWPITVGSFGEHDEN